ncbi:MAG: dTDP-4-dehydrorhamnose reductase [Candidatus Binatia bacterium]
MKILITGARGQLGRALPSVLPMHTVCLLDHQQLDICQFDTVRVAIERVAPDLVINAAAYNKVDEAESDPAAAYRGNALGPRNLAVVTAAHRVPLLHVSTDYVFDGDTLRPYHEFDRPHPQSVYGASKLAGEEAVQTLNPRHYIVRTAWLYHPEGRNFLNTMWALASQPEVRVVSDQYGSPTYVPHLVQAIASLVSTGAYGTYHFAGYGGTSWYELTQVFYHLLGITTPVRSVSTQEFPRPAMRPRYSVLTTIQDPCILLPPWEDGVKDFVAATKA